MFQFVDKTRLSITVSNSGQERSVTEKIKSPERPPASEFLEDSASITWIKSELLKVSSGLWATRLEHLYKEKFKKSLPSNFIEELRFRPDVTIVDEPIPGRYLLYSPKKQQVPMAFLIIFSTM